MTRRWRREAKERSWRSILVVQQTSQRAQQIQQPSAGNTTDCPTCEHLSSSTFPDGPLIHRCPLRTQAASRCAVCLPRPGPRNAAQRRREPLLALWRKMKSRPYGKFNCMKLHFYKQLHFTTIILQQYFPHLSTTSLPGGILGVST